MTKDEREKLKKKLEGKCVYRHTIFHDVKKGYYIYTQEYDALKIGRTLLHLRKETQGYIDDMSIDIACLDDPRAYNPRHRGKSFFSLKKGTKKKNLAKLLPVVIEDLESCIKSRENMLESDREELGELVSAFNAAIAVKVPKPKKK